MPHYASEGAKRFGGAAISATVFAPRITSRATRALNLSKWLLPGSLVDLSPVTAGYKST